MSTKGIEWCLKTSIHFLKAIWFSNHDFGTSTTVKGEGINGVGVSDIGDEVYPFSNFVDERVSFLLGAIDKCYESLKGKKMNGKV